MSIVRVLIVDDSPTARLSLRQAFTSDPEIQVVGEASCANEAFAVIERTNPHIVTMDVYLHHENGIDLTAAIMAKTPRPILLITSLNPKDPQLVYKAIEAGALDVQAKLPAPANPSYASERGRLLQLVKTLSSVPVVRRIRTYGQRAVHAHEAPTPRGVFDNRYRSLLIGASTGGPPAVCELLQNLPERFPLPIAIVQHISIGFADGFGKWLADSTGRRVDVVRQPMEMAPGHVYVAADDLHLTFASHSLIQSSAAHPRSYQRPSVDVLFESGARTFGAAAIGVLLTGMGSDGAKGMAALKHEGAFTLAQEPKTCVVDSMPLSAITAGAVDVVGGLDAIAEAIGAKLAAQGHSD